MTIEIEFNELVAGSQAVRVAAREATFVPGQDFIETRIDLKAGGTCPDSPLGVPPVLKDSKDPGGHPITLFGATGTSAYVNELAKLGQKPVFIPDSPDILPLAHQWTELATGSLFPLIDSITRHGRLGQDPTRRKGAFSLAIAGVQGLLQTLETKVFVNQQQPAFLVDHDGKNVFTLGDIALASGLTYVRILPAGRKINLDDFPKTKAYLQSIEARPAFLEVFAGVTIPKGVDSPPDLEEPPNP